MPETHPHLLYKPEHVFQTDTDSSQHAAMEHTGPVLSLIVYFLPLHYIISKLWKRLATLKANQH